LFAAPAAAHAWMSLVAFALELGPLRGMFPPIHDRSDCEGSAISELDVPSICPCPVSHVYALDADRICEWQPLDPQLPMVPDAK